MELKRINLSDVEIRLDETVGVFEGYASVFGGVDSYGDTILPGAYSNTLAKRERPIRMRWNHWGAVIGKWLSVSEDKKGLRVKGELTPGHSVAQNVLASLKHGAVDGLSIGFRPVQVRDLGKGRRELIEIDLVEISVVEEPADLGARVSGIKASIDDAQSIREIEACLRDSGVLSRADACALVSRMKALARGELEAERKQAQEILAMCQQFAPKSN